MRMIDVDALIGPIKLLEESYRRCGAIERAEAYANCLWEIEQAPTVGGWIKCTPDTMPETNDEVLTTYIVNGDKKRRYVEAASCFYDGEEWYWTSAWDEYRVAGTRKEVLAWMPMPKPYNPSKED